MNIGDGLGDDDVASGFAPGRLYGQGLPIRRLFRHLVVPVNGERFQLEGGGGRG